MAFSLGAPIETLWSLTLGLLGQQDLVVRWMEQQLCEIRASEPARVVTQLGQILREMRIGSMPTARRGNNSTVRSVARWKPKIAA